MPTTPHSSLSLSSSKGLVRIIMPVKWLLIALDQAVEVLALIGVIPRILLRCSTGFGGRLVAADALQHLLLCLLLELPAGIGRRRRPLVEGALGPEGGEGYGPPGRPRPRRGP